MPHSPDEFVQVQKLWVRLVVRVEELPRADEPVNIIESSGLAPIWYRLGLDTHRCVMAHEIFRIFHQAFENSTHPLQEKCRGAFVYVF